MNIETKVAELMETLNYAVSPKEVAGVLRRALESASRLPDEWVAAANSRAAATEKLLRDADTALRDLGACAAPDCEEPNCLRIRQRIEQHLAGGW
jgi:hypothetical protein